MVQPLTTHWLSSGCSMEHPYTLDACFHVLSVLSSTVAIGGNFMVLHMHRNNGLCRSIPFSVIA